MPIRKKNFTITGGRGFHMRLPNGYSVSVQWGIGTYSDHHDVFPEDPMTFDQANRECGAAGSDTAETAVFNPAGEFVKYDGDDVQAYQTPEQVLQTIMWAAAQK